jgi:hypothetical protein
VRRTIISTAIGALLIAGCGSGGSHGVVEGSFSLPGRPAADLQRGGLNFSLGQHGKGHGHTTTVGPDGRYTLKLSPGSYSVIGALSGRPGGPPPETCAGTMTVVVTADTTTHADYVCLAQPVNRPAP